MNAGDMAAALVRLLRAGPPPALAVIRELGAVGSRSSADIAVVEGEGGPYGGAAIHGYEIKGRGDDFRRLRNQASWYSEVFDRVTLAVHPRHDRLAMRRSGDVFPAWWGIVRIGPDGEADRLSPSKANPSPSVRRLADFLWKDHAWDMLMAEVGRERGFWKGGRRRGEIIDRLCGAVPAGRVHGLILGNLVETSGMRGASVEEGRPCTGWFGGDAR